MNAGKTVFAQVLEHLPRYEFDKFVKKYEGNHRVRSFPCYDQFLCIAYAQLTYRESLRDIETCLNSHHEKLYHIGFRGQISRSTMADAGEMRDYRIYQDFAYHLISIARKLYQNKNWRSIWIILSMLSTQRPSICVFPSFLGHIFARPKPPSRCTPSSICGETFRHLSA